MKHISYKTNVLCPRCGKKLYTTDIAGYVFVCKECNENFYGIEAQIPNEGMEIIFNPNHILYMDHIPCEKELNNILKYIA